MGLGFLSSDKFISTFVPFAGSAALHVGLLAALTGFWGWGEVDAPRPQVVVIELVEAKDTAHSRGVKHITDKKGAISQKAQKQKSQNKPSKLAVLSSPDGASDLAHSARDLKKSNAKDNKTQPRKKRSASSPGSAQQMKGAAKHSLSHGPKFSGKGLSNPRPHYPQTARLKGQQGRVVLKVRVSAKGRPMSVRISRSSGVKALDSSAMRAVKKWRFHPARKNGRPVVGIVYAPISFRLVN